MSNLSNSPIRIKRLPRLALVCGLSLLLGAGLAGRPLPVQAAKEMSGPSDLQNTIPGTSLTRDAFRARAFAQLTAVALNAHAFYAVNGDFPATFYDLFNSDAWNLDIHNVINGRNVDAIEFTPGHNDFTTTAPSLMPMPGSAGDAGNGAPGQPPLKATGNLTEGLQLDMNELSKSFDAGSQNGRRVDPKAIEPKTPGNIYYYTSGKLLQLVLFAPDGTYMEYVASNPNTNWLALLNIKSSGRSFPADLYANQVLLYMERVLPRNYNLVRFMSNNEPLPEPVLQQRTAAERLKMSDELGITVFNPYTKHAAKAAEAPPKAGDFAAQPVPVTLALRSGEVVSFDQLSAGLLPPGAAKPGPAKPGPKPTKPSSPPPLGGRPRQ
jgi:hypothetical protein